MGVSSAIAAAASAATNTSAANSSTASSGSSGINLASNFTTFLNLLTTQLQNQDPTNPVDSNQFTQQLVEFAGVQQQVQTNTQLSSILSALQGNQVSSASSFVGTTVQATGNQGALTNSKTDFGYTLPSAAASAMVTIKDSSGNIVYTGSGPVASGSNVVEWDGQNSLNGVAVKDASGNAITEPDGIYTISVDAKDANGTAITATPFTIGTVTSASISNGTVMLNIGALQIPETSVTNVTNLPTNATSTTSTSTSSTTPTASSS